MSSSVGHDWTEIHMLVNQSMANDPCPRLISAIGTVSKAIFECDDCAAMRALHPTHPESLHRSRCVDYSVVGNDWTTILVRAMRSMPAATSKAKKMEASLERIAYAIFGPRTHVQEHTAESVQPAVTTQSNQPSYAAQPAVTTQSNQPSYAAQPAVTTQSNRPSYAATPSKSLPNTAPSTQGSSLSSFPFVPAEDNTLPSLLQAAEAPSLSDYFFNGGFATGMFDTTTQAQQVSMPWVYSDGRVEERAVLTEISSNVMGPTSPLSTSSSVLRTPVHKVRSTINKQSVLPGKKTSPDSFIRRSRGRNTTTGDQSRELLLQEPRQNELRQATRPSHAPEWVEHVVKMFRAKLKVNHSVKVSQLCRIMRFRASKMLEDGDMDDTVTAMLDQDRTQITPDAVKRCLSKSYLLLIEMSRHIHLGCREELFLDENGEEDSRIHVYLPDEANPFYTNQQVQLDWDDPNNCFQEPGNDSSQ
ncbi:hypothetical protein CF319_g7136 [Tilletia indica]|nr:hypothetical protein CF319_g7136 [Tilletia indica]